MNFDSGDVVSLRPGQDTDKSQDVLDLEQIRDKEENARNLSRN